MNQQTHSLSYINQQWCTLFWINPHRSALSHINQTAAHLTEMYCSTSVRIALSYTNQRICFLLHESIEAHFVLYGSTEVYFINGFCVVLHRSAEVHFLVHESTEVCFIPYDSTEVCFILMTQQICTLSCTNQQRSIVFRISQLMQTLSLRIIRNCFVPCS